MTARAHFRKQAEACARLGSPFTARLLTLAADRLSPGTPVADRLLGRPDRPQDAYALRFAGALHALARDGDALAAVYPPHEVPDDALWSAVENAMSAHTDRLLHWLDSAPQTNEVRRSAALIPALHVIAARFARPLALMELGASAGLNLQCDRYRLEVAGTAYGPAEAGVRLTPDWSGTPPPPPAALHVVSREGVDLNPLDPARPADRARLLAYLWADQSDRIARTEAAIACAAAAPAPIARGDAADWLERRLATRPQDATAVVFHTIAAQYFPDSTRARIDASLAQAGRIATDAAPMAHLSMEDDGHDGAALLLRLWPGDVTIDLGGADFHGRWIDWAA